MNEELAKSSRWNDPFGWVSCACFAASVLVFAYMAKYVRFELEGIFGMGAFGVTGFVAGLVGSINGLHGRTAIISVIGMLANVLTAGVMILGFVGAFRT